MGYCAKCNESCTSDLNCPKCGKMVMVPAGRAKQIDRELIRTQRVKEKEERRKAEAAEQARTNENMANNMRAKR